MKILKYYLLPFLTLFFVMLVDGHISTNIVNIFWSDLHFISHLLFLFILFVSIDISETANFWILLLIGFLYDAYYFHLLGIATLLLPLIGVMVSKYNSVLMANRLTRLLSVSVLVFFFEICTYMLAFLINMTSMSFGNFIVYSLAPTMILNILLLLILQPVLEKLYL